MRVVQSFLLSATIVSTILLWVGVLIQLVVRRGEPHREVLFATAALALVITLFLPPVAGWIAELLGSARPCNVFLNVWNVATSGLMIFAVVAARGIHSAVTVALLTIGVAAATWWMAMVVVPSPAGCVTSLNVPATSVYWWMLIGWHLIAHCAVLIAVFRDLSVVPPEPWARAGVWWYMVGFGLSGVYWLTLLAILVTERRYPLLTVIANGDLFPLTVITLTGAVWWPIGAWTKYYRRAVCEFWNAYDELSVHGWSQQERNGLWAQSLRGWYLAPGRAAYRVRIAQADHAVRESGKR